MNTDDKEELLCSLVERAMQFGIDRNYGVFDFSEEMKALCNDDFESRTCESCKYSVDEDRALMKCENRYPQTPQYTPIDYGCNKWEEKEH